MSKLGVCLLRRVSFVKDFNRLLIVLDEAAQGGVISSLDRLVLTFIPIFERTLEVFEFDATMVFVAEHFDQHIN